MARPSGVSDCQIHSGLAALGELCGNLSSQPWMNTWHNWSLTILGRVVPVGLGDEALFDEELNEGIE